LLVYRAIMIMIKISGTNFLTSNERY